MRVQIPPAAHMAKTKQSLKIIPLGGLGEVGRNMTLLEFNKKILIIDMGLKFPEETTPGIDCIIPNITYLEERKNNIVGALFTHGHYDHIGAIPYLIQKIDGRIPMYGGPLTNGIIVKRQKEFPGKPKLKLNPVKDGDKVTLSPFEVEFVKANHNIPDTLSLFIKTPVGNIFFTSDFKFDNDPVFDKPTNFKRLESIGKKGIHLLMSDSTGAEEEGHSFSERQIMDNLDKIFKQAKGRIIVSTFASLIHRIQQTISLSEKYKRKVAVEGYSMRTNVELARQLSYLKMKKGTRIDVKKINDYPDSKITIICTGAQGEEDAVLMRIANKEHKTIRLKQGDTVIFSSSIVPGNERAVQNLKDNILRQTNNVFHYKMMDIHAGGHAKQKELLKMIEIMKPKFLMPVHGQYSMLIEHAKLARNKGIPDKNIMVAENGDIITVTPNKISLEKDQVPANYVMVDGLGVGDVGEVVLRDRKVLADDGIFVIIAIVDRQTGRVRGSPDIISRGFVYLRESKDLLKETRRRVIQIINKASSGQIVNWLYLKNEIKNKIGDFLYSKTQRRPMVLPVIIEV